MTGNELEMFSLSDEDIAYLLKENKRLKEENLYLRTQLNFGLEEKLPLKLDPDSSIPSSSPSSENLTVKGKIVLFKSLFKGRMDVYAIRWENKSGKSGYSPACANEWDRKVCKKPKIKCSQCNHQKWRQLSDRAIHDHLTGKTFIGIYPLHTDESCKFLALDFDKETWQKDVKAFKNVCDTYKLPVLLERSQSGNGAHIWMFFTTPLPAYLARRLGTALLTKTMMQNPSICMDSYDRLFPNQDTLPKGGFGNLIALPLQGKRRKQGNSTFLDNNFNVHPQPWDLLSKIKTISEKDVKALLDNLTSQGVKFDIRSSKSEEDSDVPWAETQQAASYPTIKSALPKEVELVSANLVYISTKNLPPIFINQIKKIAAFQNPEFYKAQAMRLSTFGKPRIIYCAQDFPDHIGLPRGCLDELESLCHHYSIKISITDKTIKKSIDDIRFLGDLKPQQKKALNNLLKNRYGILAATTGFGKTIIAANVIAARNVNTLVLVHRQQLLEQWREKLSGFLNLSIKDIGILGSGKNKLNGNVDIAMLQSLYQKGTAREEVKNYSQIIVDECHHISAFSFEQVLKKAQPHFVLGLTATPTRKDGHHPIISMQCGPIQFRVSSKSQISKSGMEHKVIVRQTPYVMADGESTANISDIFNELITNQHRNNMIFNDVLNSLEAGRIPILLTERTKHLDYFFDKFKPFVKNLFVFKGGMKQNEREALLNKLRALADNEERLILATGKYIGEGFDESRLDTLFLALPISWQGTLQQYVGRLHREHSEKSSILVYDYVDSSSSMLNKMFLKRHRKYQTMGYIIKEDNP